MSKTIDQKTATEKELRSIINGTAARRYAQLFPNIILAGALDYLLSSTYWPGLEIISCFAFSGICFAALAVAAIIEKYPN